VVREYTTPQDYTDTWFHYDALGSLMNRSNVAGGATATYHQDAYGNVIDASTGAWLNESSQAGFHLTTKQYDTDVGLYFFNERWYSRTTANWLQRDPARQALNPYGFALQNPIRLVDPNGLFSRVGDEKNAVFHCYLDVYEKAKMDYKRVKGTLPCIRRLPRCISGILSFCGSGAEVLCGAIQQCLEQKGMLLACCSLRVRTYQWLEPFVYHALCELECGGETLFSWDLGGLSSMPGNPHWKPVPPGFPDVPYNPSRCAIDRPIVF
jgi:RHS repeat-associated protein